MNLRKLRIPSLLLIIVSLVFGFKAADDHFEISKNLEIFASVYKEVNTHYVEELKPGELMRTGVNAMLESLDPYTNFYSESQAEDALMRHQGEYGGVGINIKKDGEYIVIANVTKGEPAAEADLRVGDAFLSINGVNTVGMAVNDISLHLKGGVGSELKMVINRPGVGELTKTLFRGKIDVKNVPFYGMINENVGYIKLDQFMADASAEVIQAFNELKKNPNFNALIFDLRDNGGGYLHEAVNIVNIFVPMNQLVVTTRGRRAEMFHEYKTRLSPLDTEIPLVVLINSRSASASEIVSGGLQDLDRAVIVGVNSFGKGLVQNTKSTKYRTQVKITTAKYYTPSGRCIQLKDYAQRNEDGSAGVIADSLRVTFKTKNGREVKDGGGVLPDVVVEKEKSSEFLNQLVQEDLLFDFANTYRNTHDSISNSKTFSLTEEEMADFLKEIQSKGFVYKSKTAEALEKLIGLSQKENLEGQIGTELKEAKKKLELNTSALFEINKQEIKEALELEITRRYYFRDAIFESSYNDDEDIKKSLEILSNLETQNKILNKG